MQPREDKPPQYWLYDQRQAVPLHRRTSAFGKTIQQQRALAAEARRLWEQGEFYTEHHQGVVIEAIPQVLEKFIRFKARAKASNLPGKFRVVDIEANLSLPTHIEAVEHIKKFLDRILDSGIPDITPYRNNLHAYLQEWGGCFLRMDASGAGFYIRVSVEQEEQEPEEILTPSILPLEGEWWQILGVKPDTSQAEVKKAYRRLAGMFHPDVNKSEEAHERTVAINRAYEKYQELSRTATSSR
ncbi:MAG: DnaJ domain-containing protein [Cyanobacteriota bacterium]